MQKHAKHVGVNGLNREKMNRVVIVTKKDILCIQRE